MGDVYPLWHEEVPLPSSAGLSYPYGARDIMVHRAGDDPYQFLHDAAITVHNGVLFAAWYNCPQGEIVGEACIRGRKSYDGGVTWSEVEMIASDTDNSGTFYVPVQFLSYGGHLYAYVANMVGHDLVTQCEVFRLNEGTDGSRWDSCGFIADRFLPNCGPVQIDSGHFIMAGRMALGYGEKPRIPAVAISKGDDVTGEWNVVRIMPHGALPDGTHLPYPETTVIVEGNHLTALVRNDHGNALVCLSTDYGHTWSEPIEQNLPIGAAKMYAGLLSTGQRYLLSNTPTSGYREMFTIAVSHPEEGTFSRMWKIRDGYSTSLAAGPEWSYPCAIEHDGSLYIVYTSEKHHCVLTVIPIDSLPY